MKWRRWDRFRQLQILRLVMAIEAAGGDYKKILERRLERLLDFR